MQAQSKYSLRNSLTVQKRVIGALLMREVLTRYGRNNIGFLWIFIEPMLFTVGVLTLWTLTSALHGSSLPIVAFAITGYSSVLLWRNMTGRCIGAIHPNLSLTYHRNVKVIDIYLSRLLLELAGTTMSFIILSCIFIFLGWIKPPEDIVKVFIGWSMLAWFGCSLGLFVAGLSEQYEIVEKLWHPASYLLFPLSGAAFIVEALPTAAQNVVLLLPMVHGVELLREGFFGSHFKAHYSIEYMTYSCAILTLLGLAQIRIVSSRLIPE